ncbi:hypothetical protein ACTWM0_20590 [Pseudomonas machongensis]
MRHIIRSTRPLCMLMLLFGGAEVLAHESYFTAAVSSTGRVLRQSPEWIDKVSVDSRPGYFAQYTLALRPGTFTHQPGYCSVSATDRSDYDDIFYSQAQLGGTPRRGQMRVQTHRIGDTRADHDPRASFLVMCVR